MKAWDWVLVGLCAVWVLALAFLVAPDAAGWGAAPAWVQAVGSIGAIGVTGWTLIRQERRQELIGRIDRYTSRGDQLESLTAISTRLEALISEVRFNVTYFIVEFDEYSWWMVMQALAKIPIHEARDPQIADALMKLAYESDFLHRELKAYGAAENAQPGARGHRLWNDTYQGPIIASMGEAVRAHMTLCDRLRGVVEKRREAERLLARV